MSSPLRRLIINESTLLTSAIEPIASPIKSTESQGTSKDRDSPSGKVDFHRSVKRMRPPQALGRVVHSSPSAPNADTSNGRERNGVWVTRLDRSGNPSFRCAHHGRKCSGRTGRGAKANALRCARVGRISIGRTLSHPNASAVYLHMLLRRLLTRCASPVLRIDARGPRCYCVDVVPEVHAARDESQRSIGTIQSGD